MIPSPAKCRSRIRALRAWIAACPPDKPGEKGSNKKLLLYGVVPEGYDLEGWMKDDIDAEENEPLDLIENIMLDTWFYQQPDKVCGKEVLTSSREFPLTIKGNREDCEKAFAKFLGPLKAITTPEKSASEAEALAVLALMEMLQLEMAEGLSGASNETTTYYQINDTLATIIKEQKNGRAMYRVETFRAYMPPFLLNCGLACTNHAWFPTIKMCKRNVDEIDALNYYAFDEDSITMDARIWLRSHPHREEGIFELPQ